MTNRRRLLYVFLVILSAILGLSDVNPRALAAGGTGSPHFMIGITTGPGDHWIGDARKKGAMFDIRYQYIVGGVNTPKNWKNWDQPAGEFALNYLRETDRLGMLPCFTYYQMLQSLPTDGKGDGAKGDRTNCENAETMKAYFEDLKLLMQKCNEYGKPVIIHIEPDLWGFMTVGKGFGSNDPDLIKMMVKSSGYPDAAKFDDTAAGFGKLIVAMRDFYAPKVLLAWHASHWGNPDPKKMAAFCQKCGKWDLIFMDVTDRDAGYKVAHDHAKESDVWWTEKNFDNFRDWGAQLHKETGLPLLLWQVPIGNTFMATCNNTDGHYMDNRAEYFLENYPNNKHIAEWAAAGYVGILFGAGAANCTDVHDNKHDGVTNPEPCKGNQGLKSSVPDDDGGYLAARVANYYNHGPVPLR